MMLASVFAGWLLYTLVETPFMNLRDRFYSSNSRPGRSAEAESLASFTAG